MQSNYICVFNFDIIFQIFKFCFPDICIQCGITRNYPGGRNYDGEEYDHFGNEIGNWAGGQGDHDDVDMCADETNDAGAGLILLTKKRKKKSISKFRNRVLKSISKPNFKILKSIFFPL